MFLLAGLILPYFIYFIKSILAENSNTDKLLIRHSIAIFSRSVLFLHNLRNFHHDKNIFFYKKLSWEMSLVLQKTLKT